MLWFLKVYTGPPSQHREFSVQGDEAESVISKSCLLLGILGNSPWLPSERASLCPIFMMTNKRLIKFNMRKAFFVQGVFPKVWHGYPQWCKGCLVGHRHSRHVSVLAPTHMGLCELTAKSSIFLCGLMSL
jgi:hypothetical protein